MKILLTLCLLCAFSINAQSTKWISKDGYIHFFSDAPMEDIEASTKSAVSILNTEANSLLAQMKISTFQFENKLMQEHFNENYLESDKFPKAILKGSLTEINFDSLTEVDTLVKFKGAIKIHGIEKEYEFPITLSKTKNGKIKGTAKFEVKLVDHNIKVPEVVFLKIAEVILVDVKFLWIQKQ
jgi:DNA-directed RNA polymerase beta' subunit